MSSGQNAYSLSCFVACAWCDYEGIVDVLFDPEQDDSGQWECPQEHWNELPADHYLPVRRAHVRH